MCAYISIHQNLIFHKSVPFSQEQVLRGEMGEGVDCYKLHILGSVIVENIPGGVKSKQRPLFRYVHKFLKLNKKSIQTDRQEELE